MSVYLSVAPPDGFTRWSDADWDRWLRDHPWESAERICSRGDWAMFLDQIRQHASGASRRLAPFLERLVNERPLEANEAGQLEAIIGAARARLGHASTLAELWTHVFDHVDGVFESAGRQQRGVYFGIL